jgi:hypothetical protein
MIRPAQPLGQLAYLYNHARRYDKRLRCGFKEFSASFVVSIVCMEHREAALCLRESRRKLSPEDLLATLSKIGRTTFHSARETEPTLRG